MSRCSMKKWLQDFHDGDLSGGRRQALADHIQGCPECAEELLGLQKVEHLLTCARPDPGRLSPEAAGALFSRAIRDVEARRRRPARIVQITAAQAPGAWIRWMAATALVLAGFWIQFPSGLHQQPVRIARAIPQAPHPAASFTGGPVAGSPVAGTNPLRHPPARTGHLLTVRTAVPEAAPAHTASPAQSTGRRFRVHHWPHATEVERENEGPLEPPAASPETVVVRAISHSTPRAWRHARQRMIKAILPAPVLLHMARSHPAHIGKPDQRVIGPAPSSGVVENSPGFNPDLSPQDPPGQMLAVVATHKPTLELSVRRAPEGTPGYARASTVQADGAGGALFTQCSVSTEEPGARIALMSLEEDGG